MIHTYYISGMTCDGCRSNVEKNLRLVSGVVEVNVDLENSEARIETNQNVSLETLQEALSSKYSIAVKPEANIFNSSEEQSEKSKFEQLQPLFVIFGYIIIAVILLNYEAWNTSDAMLDFMGLFYIVFSFFKMIDLKGFPSSFRMYDPLAKVFPAYGWMYPFVETALGLMFLMRFEITTALIVTLVVLGITTFGVAKSILHKKSIQCACLGTALKLPMTQATLIENSIMLAMAIAMLFKTFN